MSQRANGEVRTPGGRNRRSDRLSAKANSVTAESVVTNATASAAKRTTTTLTKVANRRSNAYGASGRIGAPDKLPAAPATGFTQAMESQLEKYANGQDEEEEEEEEEEEDHRDDSANELGGGRPSLSVKKIPHSGKLSPDAARNSTSKSKVTPGYSFIDSDDFSHSDDDFAASVGNTTKSFGLAHEAGMLVSQDPFAGGPIRDEPRSSPFVQPAAPTRQPEQAASAAQDPFIKPAVPYRRPASRTVNGARTQGPTPVLSQGPVRNKTPDSTKIPSQAEKPVKTSINDQVRTRANVRQPIRATTAETEDSLKELIAEEQGRLHQQGPPAPQLQRQAERRRPHQKDRVELNAWLGDVEPPEFDEPAWAWKKPVTWAFAALAAFLLLGWLTSSYMMATEHPESAARTPNLLKAVGARVGYTYEWITDIITPPRGSTDAERQVQLEIERAKAYKENSEDHFLWGRMSNMDEKFSKSTREMRATLEELRHELPDMMIVRRKEDGSTEISEEFWSALLGKARSTETEADWHDFLEGSKKKLQDLLNPALHQDRGYTSTWPEAVTREEFIRQIEKSYQDMTVRVDKKIDEAMRAHSTQFQTMVQAETRKTMMDQIRLNSLAQANLVANYEHHLTKPNYFAPGLGAIVEPDLSSVTFNNKPGRFYEFVRRVTFMPGQNPPMAALTKWEEPGDCWCSAGQSGTSAGQAQLTVRLPRPVIPKQVTIEHVPMNMMPARNISNAPRDIELWVQTDAPINPYYSHRQMACHDPPPHSISGPAWKCLGSFKYNIHASNHLQTFDLAGEPSEPVRRTMVRVISNWGATHTCLYQVRLHGTDAQKDFEYPVSLMD
jgi:SUN domain-containing protein 1/2